MYQTVRAAAVLLTDCTASVVFVVVSLNSHFMSWVGWVKIFGAIVVLSYTNFCS